MTKKWYTVIPWQDWTRPQFFIEYWRTYRGEMGGYGRPDQVSAGVIVLDDDELDMHLAEAQAAEALRSYE